MNSRIAVSLLLLAGMVGLIVPVARRSAFNGQLMEAIRERDARRVQQLLREGADPNTASSVYDTALFRAIGTGNPPAVQALLNGGASVNPVGEAKVTPLIVVATSEFLTEDECRAMALSLQAQGESLEERDALGYTPLMRAVWSGSIIGTRVLLEMGADENVTNNLGQSVWDWADRMPDKSAQITVLLRQHERRHARWANGPV